MSVDENSDPLSRWTCEACGETGVIRASELVSWYSDAATHQLSHVATAFSPIPRLTISGVTA